MEASDNSGFVLRNTSLTIRLRFTPAIACSTRTRMRASLRLAHFSAAVSSRPRGFFFRLAAFRDRRFVALKPGILVQRGSGPITQVRLVGDALIIGFAGVGLAEEQDPFTATAHDQYVLVRVGLFLAAVVQRLFFRLFGPVPTPLRAIDDDEAERSGSQRRFAPRVAVALRQDAEIVEGCANNGKELMQPIIRLGGTDAKEFPQHDLQRIGFQVDQDEQQFIRIIREGTVPARTRPALAGLSRGRSITRVGASIGPLERGQQFAKLGVG